eukprot:14068387-Alexandrium_andersonii.AAC.1
MFSGFVRCSVVLGHARHQLETARDRSTLLTHPRIAVSVQASSRIWALGSWCCESAPLQTPMTGRA